jgi:hypothetical protein
MPLFVDAKQHLEAVAMIKGAFAGVSAKKTYDLR